MYVGLLTPMEDVGGKEGQLDFTRPDLFFSIGRKGDKSLLFLRRELSVHVYRGRRGKE